MLLKIISSALIALQLACSGAACAQAYRVPFDTPPPTTSDAIVQCTTPPVPINMLDVDVAFAVGDASYSIVDPARLAAREAALVPIRAFTSGLARFANDYVRSGGTDRRSGICALRWLDAWASAGAMTNMTDHDAQFIRSVHLSGWAMDYAQVRDLTVTSNDPRPRILTWFASMANDLRSHTNGLTPGSPTIYNNNHRYWAGLATMAVAMNTGDQSLTDWALQSARAGLDQVNQAGALPLELTRRAMARHYHLYASAPLVMTLEIAAANGTDISSYNNGAIHRLVGFAIGSITDPSAIEALTGVQQQPYLNPRGGFDIQNVAWFEFYNRRYPGVVPSAATILSNRPLINVEIGGNYTLLAQKR
jgi:poly(beta-D-mannuronate) lyase